jgi:hypothetical protein
VRGLEGEVREGLRDGVDQGDERRSFRPRLIAEIVQADVNRAGACDAPARLRQSSGSC